MSTILDVAREARVAASTVSRVVNGSARISARTQQRVHEAIRRVGYQPHAAGRGRRRQRAWHLAVLYTPQMVVNGAVAHVCRDSIAGVRQEVLDADGHLEILAGAQHVDRDIMYRHCMDSGEIHGLIFIGAYRDSGYLEDLKARRLPVVMVADRVATPGVSCVYADMYGAGRLAMERLIALGHRRIALGHLPPSVSWVADQRRRGALDLLREHGLEPVVDRLADKSFDDIDYFDDGARLIRDAGATALFCGDFAAVRYIEALDRLGLSVPRDVSVIGCDHSELRPATGQALSTIAFDRPLMGRLAASTLMKLINQRDEIHHMEISVPVRLLEQETTAPPGRPAA
jgi:LacI family transcriptional regulator